MTEDGEVEPTDEAESGAFVPLSEVGGLLARLSHDLGNPLTVLTGSLAVFDALRHDEARAEAARRRVEQAVRDLTGLVHHISDAGIAIGAAPAVVDVVDLVGAACVAVRSDGAVLRMVADRSERLLASTQPGLLGRTVQQTIQRVVSRCEGAPIVVSVGSDNSDCIVVARTDEGQDVAAEFDLPASAVTTPDDLDDIERLRSQFPSDALLAQLIAMCGGTLSLTLDAAGRCSATLRLPRIIDAM